MGSSFSTLKFASEEVMDRFLDNVDVWQVIFEMLPVKDRIRLEMTNKRLGMLMLEYWKRGTSFDSECLTGINYNQWMNKNREKLSEAFVAICVNRIGDGLRSLTISEKVIPMDFWRASFRSIGEGCANIQTMNIVFEKGSWILSNVRFDSFSRLKTLRFIGDTPEEHWLASASASVCQSISTSIEVIRGVRGKLGEDFENSAQIEGFFADRPALREIDLYELCTRDKSKADIFRVIAERCPNLKSINLRYYERYYPENTTVVNCIDYGGVVALESMKELRIPYPFLDETEIVTICKRSPLVESLEFGLHLSANIDRQSEALNALGTLTKLRELRIVDNSDGVIAPSLMTEFACDLARNSGLSLRHLELNYQMPLPTAAIETLANGCAKLRYVKFYVFLGEATPASIRFLIDCIIAHPSWIHQTGERTLCIEICVMHSGGDEGEAFYASYEALAAPAANLPRGVELNIVD